MTYAVEAMTRRADWRVVARGLASKDAAVDRAVKEWRRTDRPARPVVA
jgi:hypothetical protein